MLKGIPSILPPELLKILMEMGHSDEIVLADGNFPKHAHAEHVVRCDGHGIPKLLDAMLQLMPLDTYVEHPVVLMEVMPDDPYTPDIWEVYREIGHKYESDGLREETLDRFAFYERARKAYATVATGETALYANIILKKGVVKS